MNKKFALHFFIFFFLSSFRMTTFAQDAHFFVSTSDIIGSNTEFWKAAGSDHLFYHTLQPSGQYLLDRMEKTGSHVYLRSHHTFTKDIRHGVPRGQNVYSEDKDGNPVYDFSNVNRVYQELVERGLKPIVEYDYLPAELEAGNEGSAGNDEGMIMKNMGPNDWKKWSDLMKAATRNFIDVFGKEEVRTWYFEVWNEPDGWPVDQLDVFFKMYDVFVDAVTSVDAELKVGGPACYHDYFLRPFLEHVVNGKNYVTGEKGTRIDFVSYHIYGLSGSWLNNEPRIQPQVQRFTQGVLWLQRLLAGYPELKDVEFHLNEWGMSSNYYRQVKDYPELVYRNNMESALFLVKLVNSLYQIEDNYKFPTLLLLYWGFSWEADEDEFFVGKRELLTAGNTPKPIQTGFETLARLNEQRISVESIPVNSRYGVLATKSEKGEVTLVAYNYEETDKNYENHEVLVEIKQLQPNTNYSIVETLLDKDHNNTYTTWEKMGKPASSENVDLTNLKEAGDLQVTNAYSFTTDNSGTLKVTLSLMNHSMNLLNVKKNE